MYTAAEVYAIAIKTTKIEVSPNYPLFTLLGFQSSCGRISGPYLCTQLNDSFMIHVNRTGQIIDSFHINTKGYIPYIVPVTVRPIL